MEIARKIPKPKERARGNVGKISEELGELL